MGCSKGRGLLPQQRVSFRHCCVICEATRAGGVWPRGVTAALPKPWLWFWLPCSPRKAVHWGRRSSRLWSSWCSEHQGKGKMLLLLPRCSGRHSGVGASAVASHHVKHHFTPHPFTHIPSTPRPLLTPGTVMSRLPSSIPPLLPDWTLPRHHFGALLQTEVLFQDLFSHRAVFSTLPHAHPSSEQGMDARKWVNSAPCSFPWGGSQASWRSAGHPHVMRYPKERHSHVVFLLVGICICVLIRVQEEQGGGLGTSDGRILLWFYCWAKIAGWKCGARKHRSA